MALREKQSQTSLLFLRSITCGMRPTRRGQNQWIHPWRSMLICYRLRQSCTLSPVGPQAMLSSHLAQSTDVRASRVEATVPGLIEWAIPAALSTIRVEMREHRDFIEGHKLALDSLTVRVKEFEKSQGATVIVMALKADVELRDGYY
uniref:Uncharacterized protein n=1 Tax=Solanum tuberosum TaxID=4113 RepID=M1DDZ4_SOLTU